jgi:hypothetical protein
MNVNKKHKESLFSFLFSNPEVLRELYSAISGVTIGPDISIDINTLTDVLYMDQINDLSFTIDNRLVVLIEHQSTVNENIPLRLLEYTGRIYEKIIDRKIPLELVVKVYNINHGHNREILEKSTTLDSYSVFVDKVRENQKAGLTLEESVKAAIKYCIDRNILRGFFETISSEVFNMLTDEWNWDEYFEVVREEALEKGIEKGIEQTARNFLAIGTTIDDIVRATGLPAEKVRILASEGS